MSDTLSPGLHWAIKANFLAYITHVPDGKCSVGAGARPSGGTVVFEPVKGGRAPEDADLFLPFRGEVRYSAHHGKLQIRIADPCIVVRSGEAEMTILDSHDPEKKARVPFVRFTLEADKAVPSRGWFSSATRLTQEGSSIFNDVYPPNEPFEPLLVQLSAAA